MKRALFGVGIVTVLEVLCVAALRGPISVNPAEASVIWGGCSGLAPAEDNVCTVNPNCGWYVPFWCGGPCKTCTSDDNPIEGPGNDSIAQRVKVCPLGAIAHHFRTAAGTG